MVAVLAVQFCEAFQVNVLFPFVVFMIRDFGIADREESVGRLAGLLAASFCLASFASGFFWGYLSDLLGRKRIILIGVLGTVVATAVFGCARSFPQALAGRVLAGLLNGNIGVLKSFLAEITDTSNRALAFSYLLLMWGIGCIVAPFVGGLLSRPAVQFPGWSWGPFDDLPYLLPCLVGIAFQGVTAALVFFLMEEPATRKRAAKAWAMCRGKSSFATEDDHTELLAMDQMVDVPPQCSQVRDLPLQAADESALHAAQEETQEEQPGDWEEGGMAAAMKSHQTDEDALPSLWVVVRQRKCVLTNVLYMLLSLISICVDEILPVLLATPPQLGGLGLESSWIGGMLMAGGVALVGTTMGVTPWLLSRITLRTAFQLQWFLTIPVVVAYPYMHHIGAVNPTAALVSTQVLICLRQGANGASFTAIILMMTNACPMAYLGAMNGIGQSLVSFARAFGPAMAGLLWSASITPDLERWFPLRQATIFVLLGAFGLLALLLGLLLPPSIQHPYEAAPRRPAIPVA
eukprot:GGOE01006771.1.p1 GENE.GGOE01006771.1~~GGOE01006771.1.p1  ORF type:complete len:541 (+),score=137.41 GGOE01006771.1:68-1624(+)